MGAPKVCVLKDRLPCLLHCHISPGVFSSEIDNSTLNPLSSHLRIDRSERVEQHSMQRLLIFKGIFFPQIKCISHKAA